MFASEVNFILLDPSQAFGLKIFVKKMKKEQEKTYYFQVDRSPFFEIFVSFELIAFAKFGWMFYFLVLVKVSTLEISFFLKIIFNFFFKIFKIIIILTLSYINIPTRSKVRLFMNYCQKNLHHDTHASGIFFSKI